MIDELDLHALADGQLSQTEAERVRLRVDSDPRLQAKFEAIIQLKEAVHTHCPAVECRAEWSACLKRFDEIDRTRRTEGFVQRYAWGLCCALFLFIAGAGVYSRFGSPDQMRTADFVRVAATLAPVDSPRSQEPKAVQHFLDNLVGAASQAISSSRLSIVNAAEGEIDGHRVAKLGLLDSAGQLSLLVINGKINTENLLAGPAPGFRVSQVQGMNAVIWTSGPYTMILVGDRTYDELVNTAVSKIQPQSQ